MIDVKDLTRNFGDFCAVDHVSFLSPVRTIFSFSGPQWGR